MQQKRIFFSVAALVITCFLFIVMQTLISQQDSSLEDAAAKTKIDFIRLKRDEDTNIKNRKPPRPKQKTNEPPPPVKHYKPPPPLSSLVKSIPDRARLSLLGNPLLSADGDILPLVRVLPQYPPRALNRGIEGWVLVEFTISKTGRVLNPKIVKADPPQIFNRAALRAVLRWKYKPQIIDGTAQDRSGVQTVITFELEK